jgi:hypothetical protein
MLAVLGKNVGLYGWTVDDQRLPGSRILEDRAEILSMIGQVIKHVREEDGDFTAYAERLIWVLSNLVSPSVILDRYALLIISFSASQPLAPLAVTLLPVFSKFLQTFVG